MGVVGLGNAVGGVLCIVYYIIQYFAHILFCAGEVTSQYFGALAGFLTEPPQVVKNTMSIQIWQNFYQRMMPLFTPQAERFLAAVQPDRLNSVAFRYTFSVDAMIKISHIIEDAVIGNPHVADLHVSFQQFSRLLPQMSRYRNVASAAKGLWLYGAWDITILPRKPLLT